MDTDTLEGLLWMKGLNRTEAAKAMGLTRDGYKKRLQRKGSFRVSEVRRLLDAGILTKDEAMWVFFEATA